MTNEPIVGTHTSIAKGVFNAIEKGANIGATTIQIFTANQRQWNTKAISNKDVEKFKNLRKKTSISPISSHSSYLINLGSSKKNILYISKKSFLEEIKRCHQLKLDYLIFHPGSYKGGSEKECLNTIIESLISFSSLLKKGKTHLLVETTAGQGSNVGYKFEQLAYILKKTSKKIPIGICFDTCHVFAAGYDLRDEKALKKTFSEFDKKIGLKHLLAFHLNDSKTALGSRVDRHESIGKGKIGLECFKFIMKEKKFAKLPKILETPKKEIWKNEIKLLKKLTG